MIIKIKDKVIYSITNNIDLNSLTKLDIHLNMLVIINNNNKLIKIASST